MYLLLTIGVIESEKIQWFNSLFWKQQHQQHLFLHLRKIYGNSYTSPDIIVDREEVCVCGAAYIVISPGRGRTNTGNTHTGALFTAAQIITLEVVETKFTAVTIFSLYIFLHKRRKRGRDKERCSKVYGLPSNWRYEHKACYWSVNVVKIMKTGLERLAQSTCHYCVRVYVWVLYLAHARFYTRVSVGAPFNTAVTALTGRVAHITDSTPGDKWV